MPGLRDALEEKFDELDGVEPEPVVEEAAPEEVPDEAEAESAAPARERDEAGRFIRQEKPASEKPSPSSAAGPVPGQGTAGAPASPAAPAFKPPQSWKPTERELWGQLPANIQAEIDRREKEIAKALQASAEKAKGSEGWSETIRPYEAQIRAAGGNPQQYVGTLLQTAHALSYGHPQQKAGLIADLCFQFGIQPADLDQALVQRMSGQQQRQPTQAPVQDPRVDKLMQMLEQQTQEKNAAMQAEAEQAAELLANEEFFPDVASHVADIVDVWSKQGKKEITSEDLKRAYDIACNLNPDVSAVLAKRKAAVSARTVQAATERARIASSSVRSQPTAGSPAQPAGRRAALEAAYDSINGE